MILTNLKGRKMGCVFCAGVTYTQVITVAKSFAACKLEPRVQVWRLYLKIRGQHHFLVLVAN